MVSSVDDILHSESGIATKTDDVKIAALLHIGGKQLISVYNAMKWYEDGDEEGDDKKHEKVVAKFQKYCEPRKNLTYLPGLARFKSIDLYLDLNREYSEIL